MLFSVFDISNPALCGTRPTRDPLFQTLELWVTSRAIFYKTIAYLTFPPRSMKPRAVRWGVQSAENQSAQHLPPVVDETVDFGDEPRRV
jgi:predicted DNA-binding transcriptional regulator AlpA